MNFGKIRIIHQFELIDWGEKIIEYFLSFCSQFMNEMIGELFSPVDMPEPPKESFFKGLFGGGSRLLDREELCEYISRQFYAYLRNDLENNYFIL